MSGDKDKQLGLRIPLKLRQQIKAYAKRKGTTVTQLTLDFYRKLIAEETQQEAEQI